MFYCNIVIPFQTSFSIVSSEKVFVNEIKAYYGSFVSFSNCLTDNIIVIEKVANAFQMKYRDRTIMTKQPIQILHRIIFSETKFDDSIVSFHGAAVEHNKKAYVFLASSKAGKSTLVSFLTYHGLKYIADDRVFVNRNNKMVQPVIIPIHLRQNGFDILKSFGESPKEYTIVGEGESKRIVFTPTNFSVDPLPIQAIMFIKRENKNSFEKIEKSNSFDSLLKSSSCVNQIDIDYVRFVNFLSTFSAFDLIYKDLFFVLDCIYKL